MGAKVDFLTPDSVHATNASVVSRPVIRIPSSAIKTDGGTSVVFIVRDGRLVRRPVTTGPVSGGYLEVRSGLSGGEQLLVGGVETPADHMKVKVQ